VLLAENADSRTAILESLARPALRPAEHANGGAADPRIPVRVEAEGDPELLSQHQDVVFLPENWRSRDPEESWNRLGPEMYNRLWAQGQESYLDLIICQGPMAEEVQEALADPLTDGAQLWTCLLYLFAARNVIGPDLPLVMERPFLGLGEPVRAFLAKWLDELPCQMILLLEAEELKHVSPEWPVWQLD
jgi:hypothetical protein